MNQGTSNTFRCRIALRWSDMDAFNHVNNARFLTFLEQARIEWFETIGEDWVTDSSGPVIASATLNFRRPIGYPSQIDVELFIEKLGTSSMVIGHRILAEDGSLHCDGNVVAVWIDRHSGRPTPLPGSVRRAAERLQVIA